MIFMSVVNALVLLIIVNFLLEINCRLGCSLLVQGSKAQKAEVLWLDCATK